MKVFKKYYYYVTDKKKQQGTYILCFKFGRFSFDWFTDCNEWFMYLRWSTPSCHCIEVREIRFSSVGFMRKDYTLR